MSTAESSSPKRLEIRKYANRRYYDTTHSRHLTLDEIRHLIHKGHDIRVIDAKTSADITGQVLTQIILELETPKLESFPVALLLRLIRVNDTVVKDFIEKYFNQALETFLNYQKNFEEKLRESHGLPSALAGFPDWTKTMFGPWANLGGNAAGAAPTPPPESSSSPPSTETQALISMIEDLRREMAELRRASSSKPRRSTQRKKRPTKAKRTRRPTKS